MRHVLGVLGIMAAGVLLAVSAAMNWQFGFSLGRTEFDGQIYGAASAAADCFKALVPFFFFAAIRNRMWSQASASAVVWLIVTAYSFTSCLGHAALNRWETTGGRQAEAQTYKDLRADLKRAQDQLSWIPQHRPPLTIQSDIDNAKNQRAWNFTNGCTDVSGKQGRDFCKGYHGFSAELASAIDAAALEKRAADLQGKLAGAHGGSVMAEADPQAAVLARITNLDIDKVQMAMTIFIALLLEIGSGFGMYIAFSQWRLYESYAPRPAPAATMEPARAPVEEKLTVDTEENQRFASEVTAPVLAIAPPHAETGSSAEDAAGESVNRASEASSGFAERREALAAVGFSANDNKLESRKKAVLPESDVQRYYRERIESRHGGTLSVKDVLRDYVAWCEEKNRKPLAASIFGKEFQECGMTRERSRYKGIALKAAAEPKAAQKPPARETKAA